jgi:CubicO group peptidase (beta-lactamase class C family)
VVSRRARFGIVGLLVVALNASAAPYYNFSNVDELMRETVARNHFEGGAVLVVQDGETVHERYYGRYGPTTALQISTSTRWVTVATIFALVDRGILDLNRPIRDYLHEFQFSNGDIPLGALLSLMSQGDEGRHDRWRDEWTPERYAKQIAQNTEIKETPASYERYAVSGMQIAAYVAERATGMRWYNIFDTYLRFPCRMVNSYYGGHSTDTRVYVETGLTTTVRDYGNFLSMLLNGGEFEGTRVLSEEGVATLIDHVPRTVLRGRFSTDVRQRLTMYRLGRWVDELNSEKETVQISSQGRHGFMPWIRFDRNMYGVVMLPVKKPESIHSNSTSRRVANLINEAMAGE